MMRYSSVFAVFAALSCTCATARSPDAARGSVDLGPTDPEMCAQACATLRAAGCPEGLDEDCIGFCEDTEKSGYLSLHTHCVADAGTLGDVRACGVRCTR